MKKGFIAFTISFSMAVIVALLDTFGGVSAVAFLEADNVLAFLILHAPSWAFLWIAKADAADGFWFLFLEFALDVIVQNTELSLTYVIASTAFLNVLHTRDMRSFRKEKKEVQDDSINL